MLSRNTYIEIDLSKVLKNVEKIIDKYNEYEYYIGIVKADCYGLEDVRIIKKIIEGGCNYLAVATYEEAIAIRKNFADIPILCLGIVPKEYIREAMKNRITITINSLEYLYEIKNIINEETIVHIKLNTGMNRLGISNKEEVKEVYELLNQRKVNVEGIYSHIYNAESKECYEKQFNKYEELVSYIGGEKIKIRHLAATETLVHYTKAKCLNGCRLGIIMYGFTSDKELLLESTFKLKSEVIQINVLERGETVGYNGTYMAEKKTNIAVIPIGYADGIIRKNKGRHVYINDNKYEIVGNICMDMLFVKVDDSVRVHDTVEILRDIEHVEEVAEYLDTVAHEVICTIGKRIPRICN